jgi:hypothetical protein
MSRKTMPASDETNYDAVADEYLAGADGKTYMKAGISVFHLEDTSKKQRVSTTQFAISL